MAAAHPNSFKARKSLKVGAKNYTYYSLKAVEKEVGDLSRLPVSLRILMENLVRHEDGTSVKKEDIAAFADWVKNGGKSKKEINFRCARVLMQDFTGVPAVVDLAAMRDAMGKLGGDATKINPLVPVDLVIDHSVIVDNFGNNTAFGANVKLEYERNLERYQFLRWGSMAFDNFRVVPPGTGICHQVNLEYLSQVVFQHKNGKETVLYPDTLVGTDSHTTMVNGLAVLGWGVGGIEAEASMLGQPQPMVIPEVVGFKLTGKLPEGATATDLVLTVTQMLRKKGVVGKFVEFYGEGLDEMPLANRATIANMAPEYGATCGFFPVDGITLGYMKTTNRGNAAKIAEAYAKKQGLWRSKKSPDPVFTDTLALDMGDVVPSLAGPKRPQDRVSLTAAAQEFAANMEKEFDRKDTGKRVPCAGTDYDLGHGDVVIAAITSCTNTSNPYVMLGAGLIAQRGQARAQGEAVGEDLAGAGLAGRDRILRCRRPHQGPQQCRFQPGRLRLHLVHRQLRPAGRSGHQGDRRRRSRGLLGALRQPQLRRPRQSADPRQLPGLAHAGCRLRAGRLDEDRHHQGSDRPRQGRQAGVPEGHLALEHGSVQDGRQVRHRPGLQEALRRRLQGRQVLALDQDQADDDLRVGQQLDLRAEPAVL